MLFNRCLGESVAGGVRMRNPSRAIPSSLTCAQGAFRFAALLEPSLKFVVWENVREFVAHLMYPRSTFERQSVTGGYLRRTLAFMRHAVEA